MKVSLVVDLAVLEVDFRKRTSDLSPQLDTIGESWPKIRDVPQGLSEEACFRSPGGARRRRCGFMALAIPEAQIAERKGEDGRSDPSQEPAAATRGRLVDYSCEIRIADLIHETVHNSS